MQGCNSDINLIIIFVDFLDFIQWKQAQEIYLIGAKIIWQISSKFKGFCKTAIFCVLEGSHVCLQITLLP